MVLTPNADPDQIGGAKLFNSLDRLLWLESFAIWNILMLPSRAGVDYQTAWTHGSFLDHDRHNWTRLMSYTIKNSTSSNYPKGTLSQTPLSAASHYIWGQNGRKTLSNQPRQIVSPQEHSKMLQKTIGSFCAVTASRSQGAVSTKKHEPRSELYSLLP